MKRTTSTLLTAALICGAAAVVRVDAQTAPNRQAFGTGALEGLAKEFDITGPNGTPDGVLSTEEHQAYERATRGGVKQHRPGMPDPADTNKDGVVSEEERQAARDAIAADILAERTKRFNELDTNSDGFLSALELQAIPRITPEQVARMIAHLDKPGTDGTLDGQISLAEFLVALTPVEPPVRTDVPRLPMPGAPVPAWLKPLDTNNDGILQLAEILAAADADADGKVTPEEWVAYLAAHPELVRPACPTDGTKQDPPPADRPVPPLPEPDRPVPLWLKALDTNNNGILSLVEIHAACDANKDGRLTLEEWAAYLLAHPELVPPPCGSGGAGPGGM
jgi:Ca2+-binding EF-hand superfamily protein